MTHKAETIFPDWLTKCLLAAVALSVWKFALLLPVTLIDRLRRQV
jgi:hypothetical protein